MRSAVRRLYPGRKVALRLTRIFLGSSVVITGGSGSSTRRNCVVFLRRLSGKGSSAPAILMASCSKVLSTDLAFLGILANERGIFIRANATGTKEKYRVEAEIPWVEHAKKLAWNGVL